ncbi:hypothetical protein Clacol_008913 [Clathrus columnatus]|uniref:Flavin-containing monooxygenase n=1 Tax=Clathrus columnatus TaxID=1419009 RepID=A0AAV5ALK3_9AGAM|nr:hypothetical protein Clacol_008913 [Clathrus columnatus]
MAARFLEEQASLPFLSKLGVKNPPQDVDVSKVVGEWSHKFFNALTANNVDESVSLLVKEGLWRDMLAFTWNIRTFINSENIKKFLNARLEQTKLINAKLSDQKEKQPTLINPMPDLMMIQAFFEFETDVGIGSGVFRIVPSPDGDGWKGHSIFTRLEELKGFPPQVGAHRNVDSNHSFWASRRAKELVFEDHEPTALLIGAGHMSLGTAACLKYNGVSCLVVERNPRVGDTWRNRYETLSFHDPVWFDHMPYLRFPTSWPAYAPGKKMGDWLESYANILELNVWTSSTVTSVERDDEKKKWVVTVIKSDGTKRILNPTYVILGLGSYGNVPNIPVIPGAEKFKGEVLHSTQYKQPSGFKGKKVVVIGSSTSGHDISDECQLHGIDVTMVQRSSTCVISVKKGMPFILGGLYSEQGPPVDVCDMINFSYPIYLAKSLHKMIMPLVIEANKDAYEGLEKAGFRVNYGPDDSGFISMAWEKFGGYYLDVGASQSIIDGKIKVKNGRIKEFTENSLVFEDGSAIKADVIVFATGFGDEHDAARKIFSDKLVDKMKPVWGLTDEGEIRGVYTECGLPNVYVLMGNFALGRLHSPHVALQIKAKEEGLYTTAYDK